MSITAYDYFKKLVAAATDGTFPSYQKQRTGFRCVYRDPQGHRCAVGILIPDELYVPGLEDLGPVDELPGNIVEKILPKGLTVEDLMQIQRIHDLQITQTVVWAWDAEKFISDISALECFQGGEEKLQREKEGETAT